MSTHGYFAPSFPPFSTSFHSSRMLQPYGGDLDPNANFDDDYYYTEGAYYYVEAADDQE